MRIFEKFVKGSTAISTMLCFPIRMLFIFLQVPNFKIVYKSGHVERLFLHNISYNHPTWKWDSANCLKTPILLGGDNIVSIFQLY